MADVIFWPLLSFTIFMTVSPLAYVGIRAASEALHRRHEHSRMVLARVSSPAETEREPSPRFTIEHATTPFLVGAPGAIITQLFDGRLCYEGIGSIRIDHVNLLIESLMERHRPSSNPIPYVKLTWRGNEVTMIQGPGQEQRDRDWAYRWDRLPHERYIAGKSEDIGGSLRVKLADVPKTITSADRIPLPVFKLDLETDDFALVRRIFPLAPVRNPALRVMAHIDTDRGSCEAQLLLDLDFPWDRGPTSQSAPRRSSGQQ